MKRILLYLLILVMPIAAICQNLLQDHKITPYNRDSLEMFGFAMAMDGRATMISSPFKHVYENGAVKLHFSGAVHAYNASPSAIEHQQVITSSLPRSVTHFGRSIDLYNDVCVIGVPYDDFYADGQPITNGGLVYVNRWNGGQWVEDGVIFPMDAEKVSGAEPHGSFGQEVKIDETFIYTTAIYTGDIANEPRKYRNTGATFIYRYDDKSTTFYQKLLSDTTVIETALGSKLAVYGDYLAVAYEYESTSDSLPTTGSVHIYKNNGDSFEHVQKLTLPSAGKNARFGTSISLNESYLAVGSLNHNEAANHNGSVSIYEVSPDSFTLYKTLIHENGNDSNHFGYKVHLTDSLLIVGAPKDDFDANGENEITNSGAAYIYAIENDFDLLQKLTPTKRFKDEQFGYNIEGRNDFLLIASISTLDGYDETRKRRAGAVYAFDKDGPSGLFKLRIPKLLNVYPSPAINNITIQIPKEMGSNTIVRLYSLSGALILEEQVLENSQLKSLNVEGIKPGAYLIKISDGNRSYSSRFIKE